MGTLDEALLWLDLAPGGYPERIGFQVVDAADPNPEKRIQAARTSYEVLGREIAQRFDGGVKMSSLQRFGMVEDLWDMALRDARAAIGQSYGPTVERRSCCFIYALPGCHECAGCPRLSPQD